MPALDLTAPLPDLLAAIVDIASVSGAEQELADAVEQALAAYQHLTVSRHGDTVVARTGGADATGRVVIAGHLDTVPLAADSLPARPYTAPDGRAALWGRGTCDMKGGVAVQLHCAALLTRPSREVTWIFYDNEEVAAERNGLGRLARERPDLLAAEFAVLCEPTSAVIEGGCQGTMRAELTCHGRAAHSARAWMGHNAIHDAGLALELLRAYQPRVVDVDGLTYREGLNAVRIRGGVAGNVVPDTCVVEINYRFAPDRDVAAAEAHVREVLAPLLEPTGSTGAGGTAVGAELRIVDAAPSARPGLDRPVAAEFAAAVGGTPRAKLGWTDVARFAELGVPAVNFGPGDPSKAHADDEFCPLDELDTCARALRAWLGD